MRLLREYIRGILSEQDIPIDDMGEGSVSPDIQKILINRAKKEIKKNKKKTLKTLSAGLIEMKDPSQVVSMAGADLLSAAMTGRMPAGYPGLNKKYSRKILDRAGWFDDVEGWQQAMINGDERKAKGVGKYLKDRYARQGVFYQSCLALVVPEKELTKVFSHISEEIGKEVAKTVAVEVGEDVLKTAGKTMAKIAGRAAGAALMAVDVWQIYSLAKSSGDADNAIAKMFTKAFMDTESPKEKKGDDFYVNAQQLRSSVS